MTKPLHYLNDYLQIKNSKDSIKVGSQWITRSSPFMPGCTITVKCIEDDKVNYEYDFNGFNHFKTIKTFIKAIEQRWITLLNIPPK